MTASPDPLPARPDPSPAPDATSDSAVRDARWSWVPIRSLGPRQREKVLEHLIRLEERDRYLRFGYPATDAQIARYVDTLDFDRDEVFGIFNRKLELIALAHLAHSLEPVSGDAGASEFGVSVLPKARGRGFGQRLFDHAVLHARNRGVRSLFIHALSENVAMLRIARRAGATVEREGSESAAWLKLPPDTLASHVGELVGEQVAELDYHFKLQAHQINSLLNVVKDVKAHMEEGSRIAEE